MEARGDVLVLAGAGTGKTHTLIERCLSRVLDPADPVSLDQVLLVTFTEAAAAEMRRRIHQRLDEELRRAPENLRLREQSVLVDTARISTLHSFCLELVRDHFHDVGLDPQLTVLAQAPTALLAAETLDRILQHHYGGSETADEEVRQLVLDYGGRSDATVRELVQRMHRYTQTLPDPAAWVQTQQASLERAEPEHWRVWLLQAVADWRRDWLEFLHDLAADNPNAAQTESALCVAAERPDRAPAAALLRQVLAIDETWPKGRKIALREPLADLFAEAQFLLSLAAMDGAKPDTPAPGDTSSPLADHLTDPLSEDWRWVQPPLRALLGLTREFTIAFAEAKRELAAVDFQDLEQFALRLLWDAGSNRPTAVAEQWRARLRFVFVDEYQDINAAQDRIIQALSREGSAANRFLVGDLKQSIYRFRLADPRICQNYAGRWRQDPACGRVVPLNDNFRSQAAVLEFVNAVFAALMRPELGGVAYDDEARLQFRHPAGTAPPLAGAVPAGSGAGETARVELWLRLKSRTASPPATEPESGIENPGMADATDTEKEAFLVARRLQELREQRVPVWDAQAGAFRPVEWRDMVVLLRAPRSKAEGFAKVFGQLGVPLVTNRGGLYQAIEVRDLLNLLGLLDNPLQDIPLLAVLRSPLVGMTLDELALIRSECRTGEFWTALRRFHWLHRPLPDGERPPAMGAPDGWNPAGGPVPASVDGSLIAAICSAAWVRTEEFLARYARWREQARRNSLSACLETVLDESHYEEWLLAQPGGGQARANVERLLGLTREFDQFQSQALFRFLRFVEAQLTADFDPEPAAIEGENAVRLMSIHQSKGLEFPVVVVADLGKPFNLQDLRADLVLDEDLGLCPRVKPGRVGRSYPSLPHWLAVQRQKRAVLGEELRLLYVAMTRACDRLLLCGTTSLRSLEQRWTASHQNPLSTRAMLAARNWLDWLGPLIPELAADAQWSARSAGQSHLLAWHLLDHDDLGPVPPATERLASSLPPVPELLALAEQRLAWKYPHRVATMEPAKTSVTALRRRVVEETDAEAAPLFRFDPADGWQPKTAGDGTLSAAERGTAHHRFLQFARLHALTTLAGARGEADRLRASGLLTAEEVQALDVEALAQFWQSPLGMLLLAEAHLIRRELEFTARLSPADLLALAVPVSPGLDESEFVVVQGFVDLAVIRETETWIVDFKTDAVTPATLAEKVRAYQPQLALYALALERIHGHPVTEAWLHFLAVNRSVRVPTEGSMP